MPRGGHKRLRPRRRGSYSSVGNTSGCRHRTKSPSCRRTISPSAPLLQQPLTVGREKQEGEEQPQQLSDKHHVPEDVTSRAPRDVSMSEQENGSAATEPHLPFTARARQHVNASPTSTLCVAVSESSVSPCSLSHAVASIAHFKSPVSLSNEARFSNACSLPGHLTACAATVPVHVVSGSPDFSSARAQAAAASDSDTGQNTALLVTSSRALSSKFPADPVDVPYCLMMGEGHAEAAAAEHPEGASSNGTANNHGQMTGTAVRLRTEEDKEIMMAASDVTASSSTFLPPKGVKQPLRNCDCPIGQSFESLWCSATEVEGQKYFFAGQSAARCPVSVAVEAPVAAPAARAAAVASECDMDAATRRVLRGGNSASAVACDLTIETPLLNFLKARGKVLFVPQREAESATPQNTQEQQQQTQSAAAACPWSEALKEQRPLQKEKTAVEALKEQRPLQKEKTAVEAGTVSCCQNVCDNSSRSSAAINRLNGNCQAVPSCTSFFHSSCFSSSCVSLSSRSLLAASSIPPASFTCVGSSSTDSCIAAPPLGTGSGAAATTDPAAVASVGNDFAATEDSVLSRTSTAALAAVGKSARELQQVRGVPETGSWLLLRGVCDAAAHPSILLQPQQPSAQRPRRLPVFKIAAGSCQRLLLQTQELLRLVHCHNPSGVLEDAVDGALKLRDLRQVVGRHGMQRPSIEVRRNCVLVNLPFVRAILLHACVMLLPPADFSSAGYSPFAQFKKKRPQQPLMQQQRPLRRNEQQHLMGEGSYEQPEEVRGSKRDQVERPLQHGEVEEGARRGEQHSSWERQLVKKRGADMVESENGEQQQSRPHHEEERATMASQAETAGHLPGGLRQRCENPLISSSRGGGAATRGSLWNLLRCGRHPHQSEESREPLSSSYGSNNGRSDYVYLWGGETAAPLDLRSPCCRGASLQDIPTQPHPSFCAQRKIHPFFEEEQKHTDSPPAAVFPTSVLDDWLEGSEDGVYLEQQHRLISKLMLITAAGAATTAATAPAGAAPAALSGPAECAAFEAILEHVCEGLTAELEPIAEAAACVLRVIHEQPSSTRKLRKVADLRRRLDSIKSEARGADDALRSLLDSEDHLRRLEVSRFWGGEEAALEWLRPSRTASSQDFEMLLESYEQELDALLKGIVRTEEALDDALQLMELHLASIRNAFLKSEIALDVVGVVFGAIAAIASVFGMNIKSGWEDNVNTFWTLAGSLCFLSCITCCLVYVWFRRQKL